MSSFKNMGRASKSDPVANWRAGPHEIIVAVLPPYAFEMRPASPVRIPSLKGTT